MIFTAKFLKTRGENGILSAPTKLYHGTNMYGIVSILRDNKMIEGLYWGRKNEPHGIRFTRSKQIAENDFALETLGGDEGAVIEFNAILLAKDYNLVDYEDVDCQGNKWSKSEKEVVVLSSLLKNVKKYITAIYLKNFTSDKDIEDYSQLVEEEYGMPAKVWLEEYAKLLKNPLVKGRAYK